MNSVPTYLHALDGRLRVKVSTVKGSPQKAREVEHRLGMCEGITQITANPTTGSVLVLYDPQHLSQETILEQLRALGCFVADKKVRTVTQSNGLDQRGFGRDLIETVVRSTMEFALQRLVFTLI